MPATVYEGDCNALVADMRKEIPKGALTLAFVDPTGVHVWFETLETLATDRSVDLVILVPIEMDIVRNLDLYLESNPNLDRALGVGSKWRIRLAQIGNLSSQNIAELILDEYTTQLERRLEYGYFDAVVLRDGKRPLYRLLYASRHERGLDFWRKSTKKYRHGDSLF